MQPRDGRLRDWRKSPTRGEAVATEVELLRHPPQFARSIALPNARPRNTARSETLAFGSVVMLAAIRPLVLVECRYETHHSVTGSVTVIWSSSTVTRYMMEEIQTEYELFSPPNQAIKVSTVTKGESNG